MLLCAFCLACIVICLKAKKMNYNVWGWIGCFIIFEYIWCILLLIVGLNYSLLSIIAAILAILSTILLMNNIETWEYNKIPQMRGIRNKLCAPSKLKISSNVNNEFIKNNSEIIIILLISIVLINTYVNPVGSVVSHYKVQQKKIDEQQRVIEQIKKAKPISEYEDYVKPSDFKYDTVSFGSSYISTRKHNFSNGAKEAEEKYGINPISNSDSDDMPLQWVVLEKNDEYAVLLCYDIIENNCYFEENYYYSGCNYDTSYVNKKLSSLYKYQSYSYSGSMNYTGSSVNTNTYHYNLTDAEKEMILSTKIDNSDSDFYFYILSDEEYKKYFSKFKTNGENPNGSFGFKWWLRCDEYKTSGNCGIVVYPKGNIVYNDNDDNIFNSGNCGIRPAVKIKMK